MPTDQTGPLIADEAPPQASPIENEIPTYRAISNRAVFSVVCGALASFSYANLSFLIFAALAVVLGVLANRAIKRNADTLTGTRLANAGIAMGVIFGLTVMTYSGLQWFIVRREASRFGLEYLKVLKEGSLGDALLYRDPPDRRKDTSAAAKEQEFEKMKSRDRMMLEMKMSPLTNLRKAVKSPNVDIRFVGVEGQGVDESLVGGVFYFATVLYELDGAPPIPGTVATGPHQFALAVIKGKSKGRHFDWWVDDTVYPYVPQSYQVQVKPVDDGHGHGQGGH